jgi:anti-anti-sigma factor
MGIQTWYDNTIIADLPAEPNIRERLDRIIRVVSEGKVGDIVLDFSSVGIINSVSLSGLLQLQKVVSDAGQRLILCNVSPMTQKIFNVTCLNANFEFAGDKSSALLSIQGGK